MTTLTHDSLIKKELNKLRERGFLAFDEMPYKNYIFDILAFHPETKKIEIVEVVVANEVKTEKLLFAKTLGKLKVVRPEKREFKPKAMQPILHAVGNPDRIKMLELLKESPLTYTELMSKMGQTTGRFGYHMRTILNANLIVKKNKCYILTKEGEKMLSFIDSFPTLWEG